MTETMNTAYGASQTNVKNTISIEIPESSLKKAKGKSQLIHVKEESKFRSKIKPMNQFRVRSPEINTYGPDDLSQTSGVHFSNLIVEASPENAVFKAKHHIKLKSILDRTQEYMPSSFVEIDEKQELREEADQIDNYTVELKDHELPLFGDQFTGNSEVQEEYQKLMLKNGVQYISKKASKHIQILDLKEQDPIYSSTFEMMIKEAFREDKHFIVAKMKTRGVDKFKGTEEGSAEQNDLILEEGEIISTFFNAFSILKLIFKKKGDDFIGRFNTDNPVAAINPLTNSRLIGEVEFFIIRNPYL